MRFFAGLYILQTTNSIYSLDVKHQERFDGQTNYSFLKLLSLFLKMATGFSVIPLRLVTYAGLLSFLSGVILSLIVIISALVGPREVQGWASTIVIMMTTGGLQMLALGLLGEYVGRTYLNQNHKPQYSIKEIV